MITDHDIDHVIQHGNVADCKMLIVRIMREHNIENVRNLAEDIIGIHPSAFSPSKNTRWHKALMELIASGRIKYMKHGRLSTLKLVK